MAAPAVVLLTVCGRWERQLVDCWLVTDGPPARQAGREVFLWAVVGGGGPGLPQMAPTCAANRRKLRRIFSPSCPIRGARRGRI